VPLIYAANRAEPVAQGVPPIDPDATVDYGFEWEDWLAGDTISDLTVLLGAELSKESQQIDGTTTIAWLSVVGGTGAGTRVLMTHRVVTAGGRTEDRSMYITVAEK